MEEFQQIELSIEMMKATVLHVENLVNLLGTTQDTRLVRKELETTRDEAKEMEKSISRNLDTNNISRKVTFF
jgi:hypothetical protein